MATLRRDPRLASQAHCPEVGLQCGTSSGSVAATFSALRNGAIDSGTSQAVNNDPRSSRQRWAELRFAIIGPLLAAPPAAGELRQTLEQLAAKSYRHPITGEAVCFAVSTLERWYYAARRNRDPVGALRPRRRIDAGRSRRLPEALCQVLREQYQ